VANALANHLHGLLKRNAKTHGTMVRIQPLRGRASAPLCVVLGVQLVPLVSVLAKVVETTVLAKQQVPNRTGGQAH
jgi:hypothetical protein